MTWAEVSGDRTRPGVASHGRRRGQGPQEHLDAGLRSDRSRDQIRNVLGFDLLGLSVRETHHLGERGR